MLRKMPQILCPFIFLFLFCLQILTIAPEAGQTINFSTSPSAEFIVQFDLAPHSHLSISPEQLANGLEQICGMAFERAMQKHLFGGNQQRGIGGWPIEGEKMQENRTKTNKNNEIGAGAFDGQPMAPAFRVRIIGIHPGSTIRPFARLQFVVFLQHHDREDRPIPAQAIVRDISLLSLAELSAILRVPVLRIGALAQMEMADQQAQWWHIALIATGGILVIGCGWAILFCWMNLCVRRVEMVEDGHKNGKTPKQIEEGTKRKKNKGQKEEEEGQNGKGEGEEGGEGGKKLAAAPPRISTLLQLVGWWMLVAGPTVPFWVWPNQRQLAKMAFYLAVFRAQNVIKRIGGSKLLRPRGSGRWRRKNRPIGKRATKRPNTEGVEKAVVEVGASAENQNGKKKETANGQQNEQNDGQKENDETDEKLATSAKKIGPSLGLSPLAEQSYSPPNPPNPYWTADQLERIFHVSKMPSHPRPAPPTEYGEIRIGPIDDPI